MHLKNSFLIRTTNHQFLTLDFTDDADLTALDRSIKLKRRRKDQSDNELPAPIRVF